MIKPTASFRGAGFYVESHSTTVGRRQPTYSIPFQDKGALSVDIGRAPRAFTISAILLDSDESSVEDQRDALLEALETFGPGLLVHPDYGRVLVVVGSDVVVHRNLAEAPGKITVDFKATEAAEQPQASGALDSAGQLKNKVAIAKEINAGDFESPVTGLKDPISDFVASAHLDVLDTIITDIRKINNSIASVLSIPSGFNDQIDAISREAVDLLKTPRRLVDAIDSVFDHLAQAVHRISSGVADVEMVDSKAGLNRATASYGSLLSSVSPVASLGSSLKAVPSIDTPERRDQAQGQHAQQQHFRASGLLNLAAGAIDTVYPSANDAKAVRDALTSALADLADGAPDLSVELSSALKDVAAALMQHLSQVAGNLAQITSYTPVDTVPVELIAWILYQDAERSDELLDRNPKISHPSFVQGKQALEVRSS